MSVRRLSVTLSPPKPLDEIQPNCSHDWGVQRHNIFLPSPLGPWGGTKRSHIIKFQLQSQFQRFLNQTLCVFSQMKDIKHIRQDFHLVAWVIPGVGLGGTGRGGEEVIFFKFNQIWCVSYLHEWHTEALGRGQKVKYH